MKNKLLDFCESYYKSTFFHGKYITYRVCVLKNQVSQFTLDNRNNLILIEGKDFNLFKDTLFFRKQFEYYLHKSKKCLDMSLFNKDIDYVGIFGNKFKILPISSFSRGKYEIFGNKIYVHFVNNNQVQKQKLINKAIISIANPYVIKQVNFWSKKMKAQIANVFYKDMVSYYAYYSTKKQTITFSLQSLSFDKNTFDYLIIHEISHYFFQNHSKNFWLFLENFCPNWPEFEKNLNFKNQ